MAQFDVLKTRDTNALVVDVQSDLLNELNTRVVVPLVRLGTTFTPAKRLNPVFSIAGDEWILATQFVASVSQADLVGTGYSLPDRRDEITSALDMLYQGF